MPAIARTPAERIDASFVGCRGTTNDAYARRADGSAPPSVLHETEGNIFEMTYSRDGEWMVYRQDQDLYAVRLGTDDPVLELAVTDFDENNPSLSPDGRWIAYASNESGRTEVYVHPFPNTGDARWLVSTNGGSAPRRPGPRSTAGR